MIVSENVLASMRRTNKLFESEVAKNRNISALENIYTSDARILPPGAAMIEGRDNIKNFWRQTIAGPATQSATLDTVIYTSSLTSPPSALPTRATGAGCTCSPCNTGAGSTWSPCNN